MRSEATAQKDIAVGLEPSSPPAVTVAATGGLVLHVRFEDGIEGTVRFLPSYFTGVFEPLRDPSFFALATVEHGAVTWPGELDLAPDAMYEALKQHGSWVLR